MRASAVDEWEACLFGLCTEQGYEQAQFAMIASRRAPLESAFLRSTLPAAWRRIYDEERLAYLDPAVSHCMEHLTPFLWHGASFVTPQQQALYERATGHGLRAGLVLPLHGPGGEFGMLTLMSERMPDGGFVESVRGQLPSLCLLRDYAAQSALRFVRAAQVEEPTPQLTPRELEVMHWIMQGKSSWEISRIMRCAEATVNFHIANVRHKFKVSTRQQALVKAISLGILNPADPHR
jgi:LuxR family quorum-sensing transcriptional regulator LasR